MSNEELQRQIDELKRTVARLQSGETRYESMAVRMKRIRNKAFERYYGNWYFFRDSKIQICPDGKSWTDYNYLMTGATYLINIMYKHGRNLCNTNNITSAVQDGEDLREYEEIANYVMDCMVAKIKELRLRHGVSDTRGMSL